MAIEITIAPAGGKYPADVFTAFQGDIELATSTTPFFDSARRLLELGHDPREVLVMRHRGSATVCLRARIGVAARLTVFDRKSGPQIERWQKWTGAWIEDAA
jgi:hypothetical protein